MKELDIKHDDIVRWDIHQNVHILNSIVNVQQFIQNEKITCNVQSICNRIQVNMAFVPPSQETDLIEELLVAMLAFAGFTELQIIRIRADGFKQLDDLGLDVFKAEDIKDLSVTLGRLPANGGRGIYGIARTKRLIGMMH